MGSGAVVGAGSPRDPCLARACQGQWEILRVVLFHQMWVCVTGVFLVLDAGSGGEIALQISLKS